jgi:hypothetical protein
VQSEEAMHELLDVQRTLHRIRLTNQGLAPSALGKQTWGSNSWADTQSTTNALKLHSVKKKKKQKETKPCRLLLKQKFNILPRIQTKPQCLITLNSISKIPSKTTQHRKISTPKGKENQQTKASR